MQNSPTLLQVLTTLCQNLCSASQSLTRQQMLIKLLQRIDTSYFEYKFSLQQTYDYQSILKYIVDYYSEYKCQKIRKIFLLQVGYVSKFEHVFQLVLDLAITYNENEKERYISQIINMQEQQKQLLMPYFSQVTKRKFIQPISSQPPQQEQLLQLKQNQYNQLKQNYQELLRSHKQLLDNHNNMKMMYEKIMTENTNIMQERCLLVNELGVRGGASFIDICEKYKRDMEEYTNYIQKLNKDIEDKNIKIKTKDAQIKNLQVLYSNGKVEVEKNLLIDSIRKLEIQNKVLQNKEIKYKDELENSKNIIAKLREDLNAKEEQVRMLAKIKAKYKGIKQVHFQFKKNFIQKMKQNN